MAKFDKGEFTLVPSKTARRGLKPSVQVVYMWLAEYADDNMKSFPSRKRLAEDCGMSVDTLDRALSELEDLGLIKKEHRIINNENTSNLYTVNIVAKSLQKKSGVAAKTTLPSTEIAAQNSTQLTQPIKTISKDIGASSLMKPTKQTYGNPEVTQLIETFTSLTGLRLTKLTEQRRFASLLIKAHGLENCMGAAAAVAFCFVTQLGIVWQVAIFVHWYSYSYPDCCIFFREDTVVAMLRVVLFVFFLAYVLLHPLGYYNIVSIFCRSQWRALYLWSFTCI